MAASPIDLSAGIVPKAGAVDISSGLVPKDDSNDTRNGLQKSFDENTKTSPNEPLLETGLKSVVGAVGAPFVHPLDTLNSLGNLINPDVDKNPLVQAVQGVQNEYKTGGAGYAATKLAGQIVGGVALGEAAGAGIGATAPKVASAATSVGDAASSVKAKLYPTSQSLASGVSSARNLSKALVVDPAGVNNFVKAATDEAGTVIGYAKDNGLPINSKIDFANAAKATADAAQSHFQDNILGPNSAKVTSVPASYRGVTAGEGPNATLGSINDRINAINQELSPNYRKALPSQTNAANVSDADLQAEKTALTNTLHNKLSQATGLQPADIAGIRQQAGKLRTIADEATLSANRDLTAAGKQAMGTTTSAVGTKAGIVDRGLQMVQGGPEIIGNRQVNAALQNVQPRSLSLPQPTSVQVPTPALRSPMGGPSTVIPGPDYTPDPNAANVLQARIAARQAAPSPKPVTQMQQWANSGAVKMAAEGISAEDASALGSMPAGRQILIKASGLSAESPAMKNLVTQAQKLLRTGVADYR